MKIGYDYGYECAVRKISKLSRSNRVGKVLAKFFAAFIRVIWPCDIDPNAVIGKIHIPHAVGIVIGCSAVVDDNVSIMSGVVIGSSTPGTQQHAHIEHDVMVGANAVLLGKITIGHHATIGANAVITKDIPPYAIVVGNNRVIDYKEIRERRET